MRIFAAAVAAGMAALLSLPAAADGWRGRGHGWGHHHHQHGWRHHHHDRHGGVALLFDFRSAPYYVHRSRPEVVVVERPAVVELPPPPRGYELGAESAGRAGRYCREYRTTGRIAGRTEELWGVACLNPDGSWELAG